MKFLFTLIIVCGIAALANAQNNAGILDSSFGENGKVITPFYDNALTVWDATIQQDNKIVLSGEGNLFLQNDTLSGISVIRYRADGSLDSSFGYNGRAMLDAGYYSVGNAVAVQNDGKIVVAGRTSPDIFNDEKDELIIVRFLPDGSLDSMFGINGIVKTNFGTKPVVRDVAIQTDGKIVIGGGLDADFFVLRYTAEGEPDLSFNNTGYALTSFSGIATITSIAIQRDGKILAAGNFDSRPAFSRYLQDGSLDIGFGNNGKLMPLFKQQQALIFKVISLDDGSFIASGKDGIIDEDLVVAKFKNDGSFDINFGQNGYTVIPYENLASKAVSMLIQPDNKILVTGQAYKIFAGYQERFLLYRFSENGSLDSLFGTNGLTVTDFGAEYIESPLASFLINNKIITAGQTGTSDIPEGWATLLARYYNDIPTRKQIIIAQIRKWLQHRNGIIWDDVPGANNYAVQRSSNGINWITIFRNNARSNNNQTTANSFADPLPTGSINYYRLQATSVDGAVTYSNVIAISNEENDISIYPNPARNFLKIEGLPANQRIKLTVVDIAGNITISQDIKFHGSLNLNISALKSGNYLLKIENETNLITKKFIKE